MKKLLTILTITAIAMTSLLSKSAEVQLVTNIEETPVSYQLAYNNDVLADGIEEYSILVAPLTQNGETKDFTIHATSNMNSNMAVKVAVSPDTFRTTLNDGADAFDSGIKPEVNTSSSIDTLLAGKHVSLLVNKFNLSWKGNADLPAGDYVSNVKIEYSIQ
ncbi:MAG: hypothetical protein EOL97_10930 [Spirochaetia bacterium]|nr:hypothetical protein [Spirochaetia bacterium]